IEIDHRQEIGLDARGIPRPDIEVARRNGPLEEAWAAIRARDGRDRRERGADPEGRSSQTGQRVWGSDRRGGRRETREQHQTEHRVTHGNLSFPWMGRSLRSVPDRWCHRYATARLRPNSDQECQVVTGRSALLEL